MDLRSSKVIGMAQKSRQFRLKWLDNFVRVSMGLYWRLVFGHGRSRWECR